MRQPKHHHSNRDEIYTPASVAEKCFGLMPILPTDTLCDCCKGVIQTPFYNLMDKHERDWYEIQEGKDFMDCSQSYDWVIGNIPFSKPKDFINKMSDCSRKGFGILCLSNSMTATRIKMLQDKGFHIHKILNIYVKSWGFGYKTCFYVFTRTPNDNIQTIIV